MEIAAIGAFVFLFVAFVVLPKKLMNRDEEPGVVGSTGKTLDADNPENAVVQLHPREHRPAAIEEVG